jgi:hypothetical protein
MAWSSTRHPVRVAQSLACKTTGSSLEFSRAGGLTHLRQPALEAHDTLLCRFEFLVVGFHALLKAEIGKAESANSKAETLTN